MYEIFGYSNTFYANNINYKFNDNMNNLAGNNNINQPKMSINNNNYNSGNQIDNGIGKNLKNINLRSQLYNYSKNKVDGINKKNLNNITNKFINKIYKSNSNNNMSNDNNYPQIIINTIILLIQSDNENEDIILVNNLHSKIQCFVQNSAKEEVYNESIVDLNFNDTEENFKKRLSFLKEII